MGRVGVVVEYKPTEVDGDKASEVTVDLGAGDVVTALDCNPSGYATTPLKGDLAILAEVDGTEEYVLVGYVDINTANATAGGEIVFYARKITPSENFGDLAGYLNIKNNGEILLGNQNGFIIISSTGNITIQNSDNQLELNTNGCLINGHVTISTGQNP